MSAITLSVEIPKDRHLVLDLPANIPIGIAQIIIQPVTVSTSLETPDVLISNPARESIRARMLAAGILSTAHHNLAVTKELAPEERERIWKLFSQGRPSKELINEDRGAY